MVVYHFHESEPVLKYFLITIGSSLVLLVSLLMCLKKGKKENESNGDTFTSYTNPIIEPVDSRIPVQEKPVEPVIVSDVMSNPGDVTLDVKDDCPSTVAHLQSFEIPSQDSSNVKPNTQHKNFDLAKTGNNPLPTYESIPSAVKIQENSGSGNSDNSVYAKIKDVPMREETAYAVVDIKFEQTYDVINGNLVNVRKLEINEPVENISEPIYEPSDSRYYDKPNCVIATEKFEEENSGASGYYASVSNNNNKLEIVEDLTRTFTTNSDLYESCGPAQDRDNNLCNTSNNLVDNHTNNGDNTYDSISVIPKSQLDIPRRLSAEILTDELNTCDQKEGGKIEKHSKLSKLNPFKGSRKHKSEENHVVDIPENNTDTNEGKAPPLPSVDKLKHITSQLKCQPILSDHSGSPASSPAGSPRSQNAPRKVSLDGSDTNPTGKQPEFRLGHRPRHSDGNILPLVPDGTFQKDNQNALRHSLKTTNSPPRIITHVILDDNTAVVSKDNSIHSQNVLLTVEKTTAARNDVIDDPNDNPNDNPDYEEIKTRNTKCFTDDIIVDIPVSEGIDHVHAGCDINVDDPPIVEGNDEVSSGYATIDFGKKQDDRRIKNLYATIDYSTKKVRTDDNVDNDNPTMYDGTYDVIPDNIVSTLTKEKANNEDEGDKSISTKEEANNEDDEVDDKYEELTIFQNSKVLS